MPHRKGRASSPSRMSATTLPPCFKSYLEPTSRTPVPITPGANPTISVHIPVFTTADPTTSTPSRFVAKTETLEDVLKAQTVGLVHLSEFKKRRVERAEERDREAAEKLQPIHSGGGGGGPPSSSREGSEVPTGSGGKRTKKRKKVVKWKLSFAGEGDGDDGTDDGGYSLSADPTRSNSEDNNKSGEEDEVKWKVNPKLGLPALKVLTNTLLREAQERETLRREFLALLEKIKNEEIRIPFVFYDGRCCVHAPIFEADIRLTPTRH